MATLPKGCREAFAPTRNHHIHTTRMKTHAITISVRRSILAGGILALASVSHAATVTWGAAQNITGDSDVSAAGTLVGAVALRPGNGNGNTTVNGVTFTGVNPFVTTTSGVFSFSGITSGLSFSSGNPPFSTLSPSYQSLLTTASSSGFTLTMSGLSVGATYAFEFWSNQTAAPNSLTTATAGNSVTLSSDPSGADGALGQWAIATFVADLSTEQVVFSGAGKVNGFQLRVFPAASAVPEPGSALAGMLALGVFLSGVVKRNRTAKG